MGDHCDAAAFRATRDPHPSLRRAGEPAFNREIEGPNDADPRATAGEVLDEDVALIATDRGLRESRGGSVQPERKERRRRSLLLVSPDTYFQ
jgi:hypothetical protein